jgi:hypothetical protein
MFIEHCCSAQQVCQSRSPNKLLRRLQTYFLPGARRANSTVPLLNIWHHVLFHGVLRVMRCALLVSMPSLAARTVAQGGQQN